MDKLFCLLTSFLLLTCSGSDVRGPSGSGDPESPGANIVFDPLSDRTLPFVVSTGRLELVPSFENCGVILVRSGEGFSHPATLFADRRITPLKAIADPVRFVRAKRLSVKGKNQTYEETVPQAATPSARHRGGSHPDP